MSKNTIAASEINYRLRALRGILVGTAAAVLCTAAGAYAQDDMEVVVVTGYRASLESALNSKRASTEMVDAINAEDIAAFPDSNLAESLQRLPGVSVDREDGEGRTITVRGLSADFTRVTLNGMEALSTAGSSASSGTSPNRSRQFDFNTFASELFSGLKVYKSSVSHLDEGSLGATVELTTGHPFDVGNKVVMGFQNAWYELGKPFNPRITGLVSHTFMGGRLGVLGSVAYNMRHQELSNYGRSPGASDYLYRSGTFAGTTVPASGSIVSRAGFSAPAGTSCSGGTASDGYDGVIPNYNIANSTYCAALSGSNSDAYETITQGNRGYLNTYNYNGKYTAKTAKSISSSTWSGSAPLTLIPGLPTLNTRDLYQTRVGLTGAVQWQVDDKTLITFDAVFSSTYQDSTNYQVSAIGLNRNNTSAQMAAVPADLTASSTATQVSAYATALSTAYSKNSALSCTANSGSSTSAKVVCSYAKSSTAYDYYTAGLSSATTTAQKASILNGAFAKLVSFVGKPAMKIAAATVENNQTTYLELANMDSSSRADQVFYTTQFEQGTISANRDFTDKLHFDVMIGMSVSRNRQGGYMAEFNNLDSGTYDDSTGECSDCFIYDATADGDMPSLSYGFDVSDPSNWSFVKGYSALRRYLYLTNNKFRAVKANVSYDFNDQFHLKAGFSGRIYEFDTTYFARVVKDTYNPALGEIDSSVTVASLGKTVGFGAGLNVPSGTPTKMFVPDLSKMRKFFQLDCNCVTDYGDFTISNLNSYASTTQSGQTYNIGEHDKSYYTQLNFGDISILGREFRGDIGLRYVTTHIDSTGNSSYGSQISAKNSYDNLLPSINLNYFLTDEMILRASASKVMSRPGLSNLSPSTTSSLSIPSDSSSGNASVTMGNPYLKPYSGTTVDLGYEWYFSRGSVFSIAAFTKFIKDVPQQTVATKKFSEVFSAQSIAALESALTNTVTTTNAVTVSGQISYIEGDGDIDVTQYRNGPGGVLNGLEFTYQQQLSFLPHPFDGLGINANYTLIHSRQHYIINTSPLVTGDGPWSGASPSSFNFTLYYDGKDWRDHNWSGRISLAYRSKYVSSYPITSGSKDPGYTDSPIMNDFVYSDSTLNVDTSETYDLTENMQLRIDALNLTNQTDKRYAYKNLGASAITNYAATGRQVRIGFRLKF